MLGLGILLKEVAASFLTPEEWSFPEEVPLGTVPSSIISFLPRSPRSLNSFLSSTLPSFGFKDENSLSTWTKNPFIFQEEGKGNQKGAPFRLNFFLPRIIWVEWEIGVTSFRGRNRRSTDTTEQKPLGSFHVTSITSPPNVSNLQIFYSLLNFSVGKKKNRNKNKKCILETMNKILRPMNNDFFQGTKAVPIRVNISIFII